LLIFLAHQAHARKLTSNIVNLHPSELMFITNFPNFLSLEHPASFISISIIIVLPPFGLVSSRPTFFLRLHFESYFALVHHFIF
jgi:hypothetical protein